MARAFFRRRKSCPFSGKDAPKIDYKDIRLLQGFMKRDVQAILRAHGDRCVRLPDFGQRRFVIEIFVAIPFTGGNPPCERRTCRR